MEVRMRNVHEENLVEGRLYRVTFNDCCVAGEFTSVLADKHEFRFENGVTLDTTYGCTFEEIETEENPFF